MKRFRIYSIQNKISIVFLLVITIVICSGAFSAYSSKHYLFFARRVADSLTPKIRQTKDLQQAATEIKGSSRKLSFSSSSKSLRKVYLSLTNSLEKLEKLTSTLSREDSNLDIVSLNFLTQAIRSQTQLIFQLMAQLLKKESRLQGLSNDLQNGMLEVITLDFRHHHLYTEGDYHDLLHTVVEKNITMLQQLNQDNPPITASDISRMETDVEGLKAAVTGEQGERGRVIQRIGVLVNNINTQTVHVLKIKQECRLIKLRIDTFNCTLEELTDKLAHMTNQYIDLISENSQKNMALLLKKERQSLSLAAGGFILSLILLYLLHRRTIVHGFANRLSLISQAMRQGTAGDKNLALPVTGRDEIADMARAAEELLKKAKKLKAMATIDELTQVYNRRYFFQLAENIESRSARMSASAVILMFDIDHFKKVNDSWGHPFGDKALYEFAKACKEQIRAVDIFARWGGEEFVLLMPDTTMKKGLVAANRLRETVAAIELYSDSGQKVLLTTSIGVAEAKLPFEKISQSIKKADEALYMAKEMGRNRVEVYQVSGKSPH